MNQVQTCAQSIPLCVRELCRTAHQLVREHIAQGALADGIAESVGPRQLGAIIGMHSRRSSLGDEIQEAHQQSNHSPKRLPDGIRQPPKTWP
jgi:hypothetical protein